jgi:hypothetical protein
MSANCDYFGTGMMRFQEKQFYKKFLSVIEIPPLGHLDYELKFDLRFYARFLSMYVAKLKLDWVKMEESYLQKAKQEQYWNQVSRKLMINDAWHKHFLNKIASSKKLFQEGYESYTEKWVKRKHCKERKKVKIKSDKIWMNCIPLSYYKGRDVIDLNYVISRRTIRRTYEKAYFLAFGYETVKEKKVVDNCLYKGKIGIINIYHERRQEALDCECEAQAINHHSTVGRSREAAEQFINSPQGTNGRQIRATERNSISIDGTICKHSETDLKSQAEENAILSSSSYNVHEFFSISGLKDAIRNQRNLLKDSLKCDPEAFNHISTVGRPCEAAE